MPRLSLRLLGPPRLERDGAPVETDRRKALALLTYLAVTAAEGGPQSYTREALAALLWPDYNPSRGFANLRRSLWEIHQALGEGWVLSDRDTVSLNPAAEVWLDVTQFQTLLAECREQGQDCAACLPVLTEAAALYQDHFLAGFSLKDAPAFDEWAFFRAEGLRRELAGALETLVHCHCELGEAEAAIPFARRLLGLDPLNEAAHRQLMLVYEQAGEHNAAVRQYQECARLLREELASEPQPETTALYEGLKAEGRSTRMKAVPMPERSPERPSGTVTFLFTDIEGSTQLWDKHRDAMKAAHARHEAILRQAVAAHGGYAYKMIGDAFQVAFATAPDALAAALDAQRALHAEPWGETGPLRVRMALHTGVTEERGDDYVGPVLNRVARLLGVAYGGQVLLTQATYDLVRDHLPPNVGLRDLGEHRLIDLVRSERIYQLFAPDLPSDFPPLKTLSTHTHNLPVQLTSFVGREKEIVEIKRFLTPAPSPEPQARERGRGGRQAGEGVRLLTVTGPGGCGKTRLALEAAGGLLDDYDDGVWLIELAGVSDPALVPQVVNSTLRVSEIPGQPPLERLADYLKPRRLLLMLDNCEHLIEACARLAETLLRACLHLRILTASQEALGIAGEAVVPVPPLATPDPRQLPPVGADLVAALSQYDAVRLFIERAQAALPGFTVTPENGPALARVCHQLDGLPLALELAAARAKMLRVEQIAARLDDRFRLLTGGSRTSVPRHQMLAALIDWSHDLLTEPERVLFRRLSVFAGGWMLEAAESVTSDEWRVTGDDNHVTRHPPLDTLDLLAQLVNKSLVVAERRQGQETRYRMLETIRQYAREKLWAAGEGEMMRQRHLAYFLQLAERAEPELRGPEMVAWLDRLETEHDNIRAALEWALESDIEAELRLASALLQFWHIRSHKSEGCDWLERALSIEVMERGDPPLSPARAMIRGRALNVAGFLRRMLGETSKGVEFLEVSLALFRGLGPAGKRGAAYALWNLAGSAPDYSRWKALTEESLALFREVVDKFGIAECLMVLGTLAMLEGDYEQARAIMEENLALRREIGDKDGIASAHQGLGDLAIRQGDYQHATTLFEAGLAGFREVGNKWAMGNIALSNLGKMAWLEGDFEQAVKLHEQALDINREVGEGVAMALTLTRLGGVALARADYRQATKLLEEAHMLAREVGYKAVMALAGYYLGRAAWAQGDYGQAARRYEAALALGREEQNNLSISAALYGLGQVARSRGDYASARALHVEALAIRREINDPWRITFSFDALATLAAARNQLERAARLFGATATVYDQIRLTRSPAERAEHDQAVAAARAALGAEAFAAAWEEGKAMTQEEAVRYALEEAESLKH